MDLRALVTASQAKPNFLDCILTVTVAVGDRLRDCRARATRLRTKRRRVSIYGNYGPWGAVHGGVRDPGRGAKVRTTTEDHTGGCTRGRKTTRRWDRGEGAGAEAARRGESRRGKRGEFGAQMSITVRICKNEHCCPNIVMCQPSTPRRHEIKVTGIEGVAWARRQGGWGMRWGAVGGKNSLYAPAGECTKNRGEEGLQTINEMYVRAMMQGCVYGVECRTCALRTGGGGCWFT
ncbi:hypothetical protein C8Q79DRAFT_374175 [Trametes meyenii]|nr:hypothetical protein C8Q79DRAFT_374175 [Trametes meyenii]